MAVLIRRASFATVLLVLSVAATDALPFVGAVARVDPGPAPFVGAVVRVDPGPSRCDAFAYGAKGDGVTDDTVALQAAISACAGAAGGVTTMPANGTFMSWGLLVPSTSNYGLQIEGTLRFFNDTEKWDHAFGACLAVAGGTNISLAGTGTVDGQGAAWWPCAKAGCFRPGLVTTKGVTNLLIKGLTFLNSPNHNLELFANNQEVVGVTIFSPDSTPPAPGQPGPSHNTDGIDVHGQPAYIHDSHISVGDDHIAMHANDTLVENCFFGTGHGASIGSLGAGTFLKNITVRNISIRGAVQALRIKADPTSSGFLRDVLYQNLALANCGTSIYMTMDYTLPSLRGRFGSPSLKISNVTFADIVSRDATAAAGLLDCDAASPCVDVMFRNITHVGKQPKTAWTCVAIHGQVQDPVTPPLTCVSPRSSPD